MVGVEGGRERELSESLARSCWIETAVARSYISFRTVAYTATNFFLIKVLQCF